jgi:hypothetical protein
MPRPSIAESADARDGKFLTDREVWLCDNAHERKQEGYPAVPPRMIGDESLTESDEMLWREFYESDAPCRPAP